ncbi:KLRB1 protein, partial [Atractosteus spatula]|nr:KLRB1 protein [Atractosteus spatula]
MEGDHGASMGADTNKAQCASQEDIYTELLETKYDTYATVRETSRRRAEAQSRVSMSTVRVEPNPSPYRLSALCLGLLCAVLLTVIIVQSAYLVKNSRDWESRLMKKEEEQRGICHNETQRCDSGTDSYMEQLESFFCMDPSTGQRKQSCCPMGWKGGHSGSCYYINTADRGWESARSSCSSLGSHLVVIDDKKELDMLSTFINSGYYWIGLRRKNMRTSWSWVNGRTLNTTLLVIDDGYPGNCIVVHWRGSEWRVHSDSCSQHLHWICERTQPQLGRTGIEGEKKENQ